MKKLSTGISDLECNSVKEWLLCKALLVVLVPFVLYHQIESYKELLCAEIVEFKGKRYR